MNSFNNLSVSNDSLVGEKNISSISDKNNTIYSDKSVPPTVWHHNGPCIPTLKRLMVSTDGALYVCEKFMEHKEVSIGNIFTLNNKPTR